MGLPAGRTIAQNARAKGINNYVFPEDIGAHGMLLTFREYDYSSLKTNTERPTISSRISETVVLPLPANLEDRLSIRVQRFDQGALGEAISRVAQSTGNNIDGGAMSGLEAIKGEVEKVLPGGTEVARAVTAALSGNPTNQNNLFDGVRFLARNTLDAVGGGKNIDAGLGTTSNPKAALYFEGVDMKQHSFNWTLMPRTENESELLRGVCTLLRRHSLPTYIDLIAASGAGLKRAMFRFPSVVDVYLLGLSEDHYMRFKPAMIQNVSYNYSPNGQAVLRGGKPATVQINLELIETDIWTAEDYGAESGSTELSNPKQYGGRGEVWK